MSDHKKTKYQKLSINELQQKCEEYLNGWKRAQADYINLEKETAKHKANWIKMANADLLMELLPIYDNLKLALEHIPEDQKKSDWVIGMQHINNQMTKFLDNFGVEEIKTVGQKFDHHLHEAVESRKHRKHENTKTYEDIIKKQIKAGYKLNGQVLYPAKVVL